MMAVGSSPEVFALNISVDITRRAGVDADAVDIDEVVLVLAVPYQRPYHEFRNQCRRNQQNESNGNMAIADHGNTKVFRIARGGGYAEKVAGWQ